MDKRETVKSIIKGLMDAGAHKAVCHLKYSEKNELNVDADQMSLFRTTFNTDITLTAIIDDKKGSTSINKEDEDSINEAIARVIDFARSSEADPANEIAEAQEPGQFQSGIKSPDLDKMYDRLDEFMKEAKTRYPHTILEQIIFYFTKSSSCFMNSNGVEYSTEKGHYNLEVAFTSKKGEKSSSFNFTEMEMTDLDKPLIEMGTIDTLLRQSSEQLETKAVEGKFSGDIIVTPDCLDDFVSYIISNIEAHALITGTSVYKDKLYEQIVSDKLTIHSHPLSEELVSNYFVTGDGYPAENSTIVDRGVLKTFLLSLYGARKTGLERAVNNGGCYIIEGGEKSYDELVSSIDKGLLVCRFSGGRPSNSGDFSGVAKNSYYIENGQVKYPVSETMISGNVKEMLNNIVDITKERVNFGSVIYPWIQFSHITVSGK